jgi:diaminohydroxyphosphoribosylaminopyrimidine deaminase/5-amino-6-(5-phosphoribosylamino)uracil reductase
MTGVGTVLVDDPALTVRDPSLLSDLPSQPLRVVLDSHARTPVAARVRSGDGQFLQIVADGLPGPSVAADILCCPRSADGIDLGVAMQRLGERGINEVLVEAGPTLTGALLLAGLVDELICYIAPRLLGHEAQPMMRLPGLERLGEAPALQPVDVRVVGADLRLTLKPVRRRPTSQ